jgi:cytochrome b pre-mRNA-processing protein 3
VEGGEQLSQALFDHFCIDMDDNLREMGVGDLTVPKKMQAFGEAFYGRSTAYDMAFEAGDEELSKALLRNVLNEEFPDSAHTLARYTREVSTALDGVEPKALLSGAWTFPKPMLNS